VFDRCCVRRTREKRGETLAAADVACLCVRTKLARVHVLNHALAQRGDGLGTHGKLLSGMRLMTPRSSRQDDPSAMPISTPGHGRGGCLNGLSRSDLVLWPRTDSLPHFAEVRC